MKIFTAQQMRDFDKEIVEELRVPEAVLIENAALRVIEFLEDKFSPLGEKRVVVLCGEGNNGADGWAIVRHLVSFKGGDGFAYLGPWELKQDTPPYTVTRRCREADIIVDALLGTGFHGDLREGNLKELLKALAERRAEQTLIAVDIPSGLNADTGQGVPEAVTADYTITFAAPKRGLFVRDGVDRCGEIWVGNIGVPLRAHPSRSHLTNTGCEAITREAARCMMPRRSRDAHKGDAGRVLVIGGSRGMSGAVALAARASLQIGAGLCLAAVPDAILDTIASSILEATTHPLACDERGALSLAALEDLRSKWDGVQAVAIGPGTGRAASTWDLVRAVVRECPVPLVVDADALHALPAIEEEVHARKAPTILTPHPGEASVLLGKSVREIQDDRYGAVEECAQKYNAIVVLKGACSLVGEAGVEASTWVNLSGNPGMATGGSGDVLTGTIAGLLAQTKDALSATLLGVYVHGLAGDLALQKHGNGLVAGDIAAHLGAALVDLEEPREEKINGRLRKLG